MRLERASESGFGRGGVMWEAGVEQVPTHTNTHPTQLAEEPDMIDYATNTP